MSEAIDLQQSYDKETFEDAAEGSKLSVEMPNTIRYSILLHVATQTPTVSAGRRLGAIFDAFIGNDKEDTWDWEKITTPRKGPDHTDKTPQWVVGLTEDQKEGEYIVQLDSTTAEYLWDELNQKFEKQKKEPEKTGGPPCQHCGRQDKPDARWNLVQMRNATRIFDEVGRMLGRKNKKK